MLLQNIALALGMVFFALAVFGSASLWIAVFTDIGASLLRWATDYKCCATARPSELQPCTALQSTAGSVAKPGRANR